MPAFDIDAFLATPAPGAVPSGAVPAGPAANPGTGFDIDGFLASTPAPIPKPAKPVPGRLEALGRGALQGATLGFADEISGALESLFTDKTYKEARNESRANNQAAQEAHGGYYGAGEIGGGLVTALIPGGAAVGAGKAALSGAKLGAAAGLGNSQADLTSGDSSEFMKGIKDAVTGAVAGSVVGGVSHAAGTKIGTNALDKATAPATQAVTSKVTEGAGSVLKGLGLGSLVRGDVVSAAAEFAAPMAIKAASKAGMAGNKLLAKVMMAAEQGNPWAQKQIAAFRATPEGLARLAALESTDHE